MARSRNIKPGFFLNDKLAEVEPLGRLLFAGLWCLADREGRLKDRPKRIKAEVLPYDSCDIDKLLNDLWRHGFIIRYEVDGDRFIQVVNFLKHQNPHHKEAKSEIPPPPEDHENAIHPSSQQAQVKHESSMTQAQAKHEPSMSQSCTLIPDSLNLIPDSLLGEVPKNPSTPSSNISNDERDILKTLKGIEGYPLDYKTDLEYIRQLLVDFPQINIREEIRKFATYKLDKPLKKKSNPRLQIRNWMTNAEKFKKEGGNHRERKGAENSRQGEAIKFIYE